MDMMNVKKIFLYTNDDKKREAIEKLCTLHKIRSCRLTPADLNRTVSEICNVPMAVKREHKPAPVLYAMPEIMLFFGVDNAQLDTFLDAYNAAGIESIKRKAVVTPTNLGWTLYELMEELGKEGD